MISRPLRLRPALLLATMAGGLVFTSCASSVPSSGEMMPAAAPSAMSDNSLMKEGAPPTADAAATEVASAVPRSLPQLVKTAQVALAVDSVDESIEAVRAIARQQQGDLLGLENQTPLQDGDRHTASMQLRVPQDKLDATLKALSNLGTVQRQSITAEDVSNQLVDFQARLRNLRKTEEMLLDIMGRSGSVGDVLKVAQELSNVRNSIEQIDAQLKDLQNRVAYSTINVALEGAIASNPPQQAVKTQLKETWGGATHSLGEFTVGLMQLGIWLLVYSPYWLIIIGAVLAYNRFKRNRSSTAIAQSEPPVSS